MDDSPIRILLIESDENYAHQIGEALRAEPAHNFILACVDRLSTGLDQLATGEMELVLLSLALIGCEGVEAVVRLHKDAPHLPIIALATRDDEALGVQT